MIERKACPDCGANLGRNATKCRCGWQASSSGHYHQQEAVPCAMVPCMKPALSRVRGDGHAWVNLCPDHYPRWFTPERILNAKHRTDNDVIRGVLQAFAKSHRGSSKSLDAIGEFVDERMAA